MRLRIRFTKLGKVRWTSHRDVARMWERALRRVRLPVAYTGGFVPRPRVSFGLALPTGHESLAEYLDVELDPGEQDALADLPARLSAALPTGIDAVVVAPVDESGPSLQQDVVSCTWRIEVRADEATAATLVAGALDAPSISVTRERKGRKVVDDVRPAIRQLSVVGLSPLGCELEADLATQPRGLRPTELVAALAPGLELAGARRIIQWIERDGARWELLPLDATDAPHAEPAGTGGRAR